MNASPTIIFMVLINNSYFELALPELIEACLPENCTGSVLICRFVKEGGKVRLLTIEDLGNLDLEAPLIKVAYPVNTKNEILFRFDTMPIFAGLSVFGWHHARYEEITKLQHALYVPEVELFPGLKATQPN